MVKDPKKPFGDVPYADPGYQADKKKRYPLHTKVKVRAAWSYINQQKNASKYTPGQLRLIKGRIKAAAKRFGIKINSEAELYANILDEWENLIKTHIF